MLRTRIRNQINEINQTNYSVSLLRKNIWNSKEYGGNLDERNICDRRPFGRLLGQSFLSRLNLTKR